MSFENDVFISYAHIDNVPLSAKEEGWVTRFHHSLCSLLSMRIGKQARIWRDLKLSGSDVFEGRILSQFPKSALLLSVVSPRYVDSDWCIRELNEFCKIACSQSYGLTVDDRCRVIKVVKSPPRTEKPLPEVMQKVIGHEFYQVEEDNTPVELDPAFGTELGQMYLRRVAKLAYEISQILKHLEATAPDQKAMGASVVTKPTVYLAECSYDQRDVREIIDAELKSYGYRVLPETQLARDEATFVSQVEELLNQSQLSIHLVGNSYGAVPDGPSGKSIVVLQNELATQRSRERGLPRIIWLPEKTISKHPEHNAFIHQVETDPETQFGADVITSDNPEDIKGAIHSALEKLQQDVPEESQPNEINDRKLVYLICVAQDRKNTIQLRQQLNAQGYDVELPIFDGSAEEVRAANQLLLQQSAGVIVFYGAGNEAWKLSVKNELKKFRGVADRRPKGPFYTYLSSPDTEAKRDLIDIKEANLLNALDGFSDEVLLPFLQELKQGNK